MTLTVNDEIPWHKTHERKIQLCTCLGLACVFGAFVPLRHGLENDKLPFIVLGACLVAAGAGLLVVVSRMVDRSKCPRCGSMMRQGGDAMHTDGVFVCRGCGSRWRTSFRLGGD